MPAAAIAQSDTLTRLERENAQLRAELEDARRRAAWADGRRGDGAARISGFTATETRILRVIAARGRIAYDTLSLPLQRHMCNIRKKLRKLRLPIEIATIKLEGYEIRRGGARLQRMLMLDATPRLVMAR